MERRTNRSRTRTTAAALAAAAAAALLAGCGPTETGSAAGPSAGVPAPPAGASTAPSAAPATPAGTGSPSAGATATAGKPSAPAAPGVLPACADADLKASAARDVEPSPVGSYVVTVEFTNVGGHACGVKGFPTVAGAGQGSPDKSLPLQVQQVGPAVAVQLLPGAKMFTTLGLKPVLGEADGYCPSGATPFAPPSLVLGVPEAGKYQVGREGGGLFAQCDNKLTATAFLPSVGKK
ncbi:DUF4232 domain-containing protein [Kitasatospora sp. NBC_00240]|uniref:DUF4232 domain-containing protein n=1 Tax=Kitasatospora sp. NBC_00240 TaxID=2903567 RepID=UPI00225396AC|nr:DUF4232 domain-containing protein [Kitasatospora sp. NBC_00240]MCX5214853.1 DUF4232 domain-containing protein [Kitasatospora sp. NBC_00240]